MRAACRTRKEAREPDIEPFGTAVKRPGSSFAFSNIRWNSPCSAMSRSNFCARGFSPQRRIVRATLTPSAIVVFAGSGTVQRGRPTW